MKKPYERIFDAWKYSTAYTKAYDFFSQDLTGS